MDDFSEKYCFCACPGGGRLARPGKRDLLGTLQLGAGMAFLSRLDGDWRLPLEPDLGTA